MFDRKLQFFTQPTLSSGVKNHLTNKTAPEYKNPGRFSDIHLLSVAHIIPHKSLQQIIAVNAANHRAGILVGSNVGGIL